MSSTVSSGSPILTVVLRLCRRAPVETKMIWNWIGAMHMHPAATPIESLGLPVFQKRLEAQKFYIFRTVFDTYSHLTRSALLCRPVSKLAAKSVKVNSDS